MEDNKNKRINILGLPIYAICGILFIFCAATYLAFYNKTTTPQDFDLKIWHKMIFMLSFTMLLSGILKKIGNNIPILKNIGGGAILCLLVPSFIFSYKITQNTDWKIFTTIFKANKNFVNKQDFMGFSEFFVAFLVVGSLLSINKNVLKNAIKRFLPLVIISLFISATIVGLIGLALNPMKNAFGDISKINPNWSFFNTIFFIFVPISCGGITCGIIPLTKIMSQGNTTLSDKFNEIILPSLIVGGVMSVAISGIIKTLFKNSKYNSPTGELEKKILSKNENSDIKKTKSKEENISYDKIKTGLIIVFALYILCSLLRGLITTFLCNEKIANLIPPVIVFLVLIIFLIKLFDLFPSRYIETVNQASKFITTNFSDAVLVIVGIGLNFNTVIERFQNIPFIITCLCCVISTASAAAFIGNQMGYYPVQSSIAGGLCANSIGGAGNLAILEASDSKQLMPFAQISTRIGGDFIVILASLIFPLVYQITT